MRNLYTACPCSLASKAKRGSDLVLFRLKTSRFREIVSATELTETYTKFLQTQNLARGMTYSGHERSFELIEGDGVRPNLKLYGTGARVQTGCNASKEHTTGYKATQNLSHAAHIKIFWRI